MISAPTRWRPLESLLVARGLAAVERAAEVHHHSDDVVAAARGVGVRHDALRAVVHVADLHTREGKGESPTCDESRLTGQRIPTEDAWAGTRSEGWGGRGRGPTVVRAARATVCGVSTSHTPSLATTRNSLSSRSATARTLRTTARPSSSRSLASCLFPRAKGCAQGLSTACREGVAAGGTDVGVQITPGYQRASPRERDTATPPPRSPAPHTRHLPSRLCVSEPPAASTRARSAPSSALWSGVRDTPSSSRLDARSGVIG